MCSIGEKGIIFVTAESVRKSDCECFRIRVICVFSES